MGLSERKTPAKRKSSKPLMEEQQICSVDLLFRTLNHVVQTREEPQALQNSLLQNRFHGPMFEILIAHKNELLLGASVDHVRHEDMEKVDSMLESYFNAAAQGGPPDEEDDCRSVDSDMDEEEYKEYRGQMKLLKGNFEKRKQELKQHAEKMSTEMCGLLEQQRRVRPITEQDKVKAVRSIESRYHTTEYRIKQQTCNQAMLLSNKCMDARRKRRNFSKDATRILQEFFVSHVDHPYPTDEEKMELASKCNITVQQVSNWFGNRRIRQKKSQTTVQREEIMMHPVDMNNVSIMAPIITSVEPSPILMPPMHYLDATHHLCQPYHFDVNQQDISAIPLSSVYGSSMTYLQ